MRVHHVAVDAETVRQSVARYGIRNFRAFDRGRSSPYLWNGIYQNHQDNRGPKVELARD
jgi:hypothetical protein